MSWARVQGKGGGSVATQTMTFDNPPAVGNLVVVCATKFGSVIGGAGVTDNATAGSNTYTQAIGNFNVPFNTDVEIWYSFIARTGASFTATIASHSTSAISIDEFSIPAGSLAGDGSSGSSGTSATAATGNIAVAGLDLVVAAISADSTILSITPPAGWLHSQTIPAVVSNVIGLMVCYKLNTTVNPESPSFALGGSSGWMALGASFKSPVPPAASGAALLMGA